MLNRLTRAMPGIALLAVLATAAGCNTPKPEPADVVLKNAKIVTVDTAKPEAQALAIKGDTIVAVGTNPEIDAHVGPSTEVIDLAGRLAVPGFIEGHGHFTGLGNARMQLRLMETKSWDEIVAMVGEAAKTAKPGEWIR